MRVYYETDSRMKISLDPDDLTALGVTADDLGLNGECSREIIDEILVLSGAVTSKRECRRLFIDAMKKENGGCVLSFLIKKNDSRIICYRFNAAERLMDVLPVLDGIKAKLYYSGGYYYLAADDPTERERIVLSEFSDIAVNKTALLDEHARLISGNIIKDFNLRRHI